MTTEPEIAWDLSDLFAGPDDPKINATLAEAAERARVFAATYAGKINSPDLTAQTLLSAIQDYEALWMEAGKPGMYARLAYSTDTSDPARGALMTRIGQETTRLGLPLVFFRLELAHVDDAIIQPLMADPALAEYKHYVEQVRLGRPHQLSDVEETLLARFSETGPRAFVRLGTEVRARTVFQPPPARWHDAGAEPAAAHRPIFVARPRRSAGRVRGVCGRGDASFEDADVYPEHADAGQGRVR